MIDDIDEDTSLEAILIEVGALYGNATATATLNGEWIFSIVVMSGGSQVMVQTGLETTDWREAIRDVLESVRELIGDIEADTLH